MDLKQMVSDRAVPEPIIFVRARTDNILRDLRSSGGPWISALYESYSWVIERIWAKKEQYL